MKKVIFGCSFLLFGILFCIFLRLLDVYIENLWFFLESVFSKATIIGPLNFKIYASLFYLFGFGAIIFGGVIAVLGLKKKEGEPS